MTETTLRHGVDPRTLSDDATFGFGPYCLCGSNMEWVECWEIGCEDGEINRFDEDPLWYGSEDEAWERCQTCQGKGGWWQCWTTMNA